MAGANTQKIGGIYKTVFEQYIAEQTLNKFPLKKLYKWQKAEYAGQEVVYNAHVSRNISPMWTGEDGAFGEAGAQGSVKVRIGQRKLMARVRMTSEVLHDSMKTKGAFVSARKDEMTRLIDDIARMEEYACTSDGRGVLCLIDDADPDSSTTMTVDAPGNIVGDDFGNRFVLPGMYLASIDPATNVIRGTVRKVVSLSSDGTSIVFDAAVGSAWADNDYVVQAANSSVTDMLDTSYEHAAMGLVGLFDDGTYRENYFSVSRNLYPQYQSYVNASTGAISEDLFQQLADVVDQRLGGEIDMMTAHHSVRRLVIQLTQADRRYTGANLQRPDSGTTSFTQGDIPFGGVPVKAIRTHPLAMLCGIDSKKSGFVRYGSDPGSWVDEDGQVLARVGTGSTGRDAFEAWYRKRYENHIRVPGCNFRLDGITGQSLIVVREAGS